LALSPDFASDRTLLAAGETAGEQTVRLISRDAGLSWSSVDDALASSSVWWWSFSPDFASDGTLFCGTGDEGVFRSDDRGSSWRAISRGLSGNQLSIWAVEPSPSYSQDGSLFAGTLAGLWRYTPSGEPSLFLPLALRGARG